MVAVTVPLRNLPIQGAQTADQFSTDGSSFLGTVHAALNAVSEAQHVATSAETAVAEGKPGASQATALVLSDRAELGWTGVVAVRNEVVSAYQTLTNMQI